MPPNKTSQPGRIDPRFIEAARLRIFEAESWDVVAERVGVARETVWAWRKRPEWQEAVLECLKTYAPDALSIAWRRLLSSAENENGAPGVTAANSIIDRIQGAATQKVEHKGTLDVRQVPIPVFSDNDALNHFPPDPEQAADGSATDAPGPD